MRLLATKHRKPEVQMSPLIDVVFLLLIFYAVTTQFVSDQRLKLKLPEARTAEDSGSGHRDKVPVVTVSRDGEIWIDDRIVPEAELEARIKDLVASRPEQTLILKGDEGADYGVVVHVLDLARGAGAKSIQMSAKKPKKSQQE